MAEGGGFEPPLSESESEVLPLDDPSKCYKIITRKDIPVNILEV